MNTAFVSTSDIINGNNYYYYSKIVFYIDNDAYITGGLGTENSPYELSIDTTVNCDGLAGMLLTNGLGSNGEIDKSDSEQTFITGSNPNNYVYYSGLLWQAVSIDTDTCSVKMRTYDNIAQLSYNPTGQVSFDSDGNGNKSYMYQWLNGEFLNNLREPENYIVMDSDWNITTNTVNNPYIVKKPDKTNIVSNTAVGLLNVYEFSMAYNGLSGFQSYLARNDFSWLLNSYDATQVAQVYPGGVSNGHATSNNVYDVYPVVNLKESVDIIQGDGTSDNPYVLDGELNTTPGTKLNTRYSGEYVTFGGEKIAKV
jgi:hypothetical protein